MKRRDPFSIPNSISRERKVHIAGFSRAYLEDRNLEENYYELKEARAGEIQAETAQNFLRKRWIQVLWISLFVIMGIIEIRLAYMQVFQNSNYQALAEKNNRKMERIIPSRGLIIDQFHTKLVENIPDFSVAYIRDDAFVKDERVMRIVNTLSEILKISGETLIKRFEDMSDQGVNKTIIAEGLSQDQAVKVSLLQNTFPELKVKMGQRRFYVNGPASAHILGYVGRINGSEWQNLKNQNLDYAYIDTIGKSGLEKSYDSYIRGVVGKKYYRVDARGKKLDIIFEEKAQAGQTLYLTINKGLQEKLYNELVNLKLESVRAAAVVIDPRTGAIRALVSVPSFDNNQFSAGISFEEYSDLLDDPDIPLFNRSISGEYPPGSTIKPIVASAALQEKIITSESSFFSSGGIRVNQWFFPDWKSGGHGITNVTKAIADSVNTFFYIIGGGYQDTKGLGVKKLTSYYRQFGLGSKLGIDIQGESSGFVPSEEWKEKKKGEHWYIGDTYHLAIGQGDILVTPLQAAVYTAAIANKGYVFKPYIVEQRMNNKGDVVWKHSPELIRKVRIDEDLISEAKYGMKIAVERGTAKILQSVPMISGAKTGTAQAGGGKKPHAWFTAFMPYDNPEIAIAVVIENGGEGSKVAAPVVRNVLSWYALKQTQRDSLTSK